MISSRTRFILNELSSNLFSVKYAFADAANSRLIWDLKRPALLNNVFVESLYDIRGSFCAFAAKGRIRRSINASFFMSVFISDCKYNHFLKFVHICKYVRNLA